MLCAGASAEEYGEPFPAWWGRGRTPRPEEGFRRLDAEAFERWASAQPPEARVVVDVYRSHLNLVSQADFEKELYALFQSAVADSADKRPLLFVTLTGTGEPKSGEWVTSLIREKFPQRCEGAAFLNLHFQRPRAEHLAKLRELAAGGKYRVLMVDDAMYSGKQVTTGLMRMFRQLSEIDLLVPFATEGARSRLHENPVLKEQGLLVRVHRGKGIPTLDEIFQKLPQKTKDDLARVADPRDLFPPGRSLTLFDHKAPDYVSFPLWIREGYLLMKQGSRLIPLDRGNAAIYQIAGEPKRIPFIVENHEPYKLCHEALTAVAQ